MYRSFSRRLLLIVGVVLSCSTCPLCAFEPANPRTAKVVTFESDIQPLLTRFGCNAGACHGKARGQNGFALSLLGFDADFDYQAILQEARGRRVVPAAPEHSLLLRKPAGQAPHGGGKRFEVDSPHYQLLLAWLRGGALSNPTTAPWLHWPRRAP
jgi:hypothetical protein